MFACWSRQDLFERMFDASQPKGGKPDELVSDVVREVLSSRGHVFGLSMTAQTRFGLWIRKGLTLSY